MLVIIFIPTSDLYQIRNNPELARGAAKSVYDLYEVVTHELLSSDLRYDSPHDAESIWNDKFVEFILICLYFNAPGSSLIRGTFWLEQEMRGASFLRLNGLRTLKLYTFLEAPIFLIFMTSFTILFAFTQTISSCLWSQKEQVKRLHLLLTVKDSAANVPKNLEARRRLEFFTNSLFMDMPSAKPVSEMMPFRYLQVKGSDIRCQCHTSF